MPAVGRSNQHEPESIPRPPNSWILYRSDMVAIMPPPPPGTTRSQGDVSRLISRMWKNETPEVRAEYERRAEVKKVEHAAMYPNYRYMPKTKEYKEELKKSKAKGRGKKREESQALDAGTSSGSGRSAQSFMPLTSHATFPFPMVDANLYGQGGPSPPMSYADSPSPEPSTPSPPVDSANQRVSGNATATQPSRSHYRPHTATTQNPTPFPMPQHVYQPAAPQPATAFSFAANAPQNDSTTGVYYVQPQQYLQADAPQPNQDQRPPAFAQTLPHQGDAISQPPDYMSFNLQQFAGQSLGAWALNNPEFQATLDQFLNNTGGDCFQLQINSPDEYSVVDAPAGPLEVEVGQLDFDFSQMPPWDGNATLDLDNYQSFFENPNAGFENAVDSSTIAPLSAEESVAASPEASEPTFRLEQFVNFDPTFDYTSPAPVMTPAPVVMVEQAPEVETHAPYVPPTGAMHSNKRRVAASWKPSFAMTDAIDV
ncbi:hypothetical protein H0H81_005352 [Sphagnurus paluster]|uniref:HMG box domain-containing protein n=1 Tax=Sphagnurus paluster TaxID=117069 RepID=A0A9P7K5T8_9AGAR|nr:hypothetical protein H0H81_005352 [Sphagnurus paluster]